MSTLVKQLEKNILNSKLLVLTLSGGCEDVKEAIENGADVNHRFAEFGNITALHAAVEENKPDVVLCLLGMGANASLKNDKGSSPLDIAEDLGLRTVTDALQRSRTDCDTSRRVSKLKETAKEPNASKRLSDRPKLKPFNPCYYIERTLACETAIRSDIFECFEVGKAKSRLEYHISKDRDDLFTHKREDFDMLCKEYPNSNVHWLMRHKSGRIVWLKSKGSLRNLLKYIDVDNPKLYPPEKVDRLIDLAGWRKSVLVVDSPGMGKSIFLTYMGNVVKRKYPYKWVSKVDLYECCKFFDEYNNGCLTIGELCEKVFEIDTALERCVFWKWLEKGEAVLMLDAVDEVNPRYKQAVDDLLVFLNGQPNRHQLWVTVRPHLKNELIDLLGQMPFYLIPFSQENQKRFLTGFYRMKTLKSWKTVDESRLRTFVDALDALMSKSIGDSAGDFLKTPLHARMVAEVFERELKHYMTAGGDISLPEALNVFELYQSFFGRMFGAFHKKIDSLEHSDYYYLLSVNTVKIHRINALVSMFPKYYMQIYDRDFLPAMDPEHLQKYGIITYKNGNPYFEHKSFAEFLIADLFIYELITSKNPDRIKNMTIAIICAQKGSHLIWRFVDNFLSGTDLPVESLKSIGQLIEKLMIDRKRVLALLLSSLVGEGNSRVLNFLLKSLRSVNHSTLVKEILTMQLDTWPNVWHLAAFYGYKNVLYVLQKNAITIGLPLKPLITEKYDRLGNLCHLASMRGHGGVVELLFDFLRSEAVDPDRNFLSDTHGDGMTMWHVSVRSGNKDLISILWRYGLEMGIDLEEALQSTDNDGYNVFHSAIKSNSCQVLKALWEIMVTETMRKTMITSRSRNNNSVWHVASGNADAECLSFLMVAANDLKMDIEKIFTDKNSNGDTVWHLCSANKSNEPLLVLRELADEYGFSIGKALSEKNGRGETMLHITTAFGKVGRLKLVWSWTEAGTVNSKQLLSEKDSRGRTVFLSACEDVGGESLRLVYKWARKKSLNIRRMLTEKDIDGNSAWHLTASSPRATDHMHKWTKEHKLDLKLALTEENNFGDNVWSFAAANALVNLKKYREWATELGVDFKKLLGHKLLWLSAVLSDDAETLEYLHQMCRESETDFKEIINSRSEKGYNLWLLACSTTSNNSIGTVWKWIGDYRLDRKEFLSQKLDTGENIWHWQLRLIHWPTIELLWTLATESGLDPEAMLRERDKNGMTPMDVAMTSVKSLKSLDILKTLTGKDIKDLISAVSTVVHK